MRNRIKICICFIALMILLAIPSYAESGSCGNGLTWTLDGKTLSVSGTGAMTNYKEYNRAPWDGLDYTEVKIKTGVSYIGSYAFYMSSAASIELPQTLESIGESAFEKNTSLSQVVLPGSLKKIGDNAFSGCSELGSVIIKSDSPEMGASVFSGAADNFLIMYDPAKEGWTTPEWKGYNSYPAHEHVVGERKITPATIGKDGRIYEKCTICSLWGTDTIIPRIDADSLIIKNWTDFTGNGIDPETSITDETGVFLTEGTDYDLTYDRNIPAGEARVILTFKGRYSGTLQKFYSIGKRSIEDKKIVLPSATYVYDSKAKTPKVTVPGLEEGKDFTVSYENNIDAGRAEVIVTGIGNYMGTLKASFDIEPAKLVKACRIIPATFVYNGDVQLPAVIPEVMKANEYIVTYANEKSRDVGTYTLTVTGVGNYTGSCEYSYRIEPAGVKLNKLKAKKKGFTASWKSGSGQIDGYELEYSKSKYFAKKNSFKIINEPAKKTVTIKKLGKKKKFFVRIRTYKTVGDTIYYSAWSNVRTVRTKK